MVCKCGHKFTEHSWNIDSRSRDECHPKAKHISGIHYKGYVCPCRMFVPQVTVRGKGK